MPAQNLRAVGGPDRAAARRVARRRRPVARCDRATELLRLVTELYGGGLERVVALASGSVARALARLLDDDLVASLLLVHGLHPDSVPARVEQAARVGAAVPRDPRR